jgi:hypothetical protein
MDPGIPVYIKYNRKIDLNTLKVDESLKTSWSRLYILSDAERTIL